MSDAMFYELMSQVDNFSDDQKRSLLKILKRSLSPTAKIFSRKKDKHLVESLVGAAGNSDETIDDIKSERLSEK